MTAKVSRRVALARALRKWALQSLFGVAALSACSSPDEVCVEALAPCAPLYEPTFENVFSRTVEPSCAVGQGACHAGAEPAANLSLDDIDVAYRELVEEGRVIPGDASCSQITRRLAGQGGLMPPGSPLSEAERCAVETWIAQGAQGKTSGKSR